MTTPHNSPDGPSSNAVLVAGVLLAGILGAVLVLLYVFSPQPRPSLDDELSRWAPYIIGFAPTIAAYLGLRVVRRGQDDIHKKVDTVVTQTNGVLDARIGTQVGRALMRAGLASEDTNHQSGIAPIGTPVVIPPDLIAKIQAADAADAAPAIPTQTVGLDPAVLDGAPGALLEDQAPATDAVPAAG